MEGRSTASSTCAETGYNGDYDEIILFDHGVIRALDFSSRGISCRRRTNLSDRRRDIYNHHVTIMQLWLWRCVDGALKHVQL